jgi:hypothetical protein
MSIKESELMELVQPEDLRGRYVSPTDSQKLVVDHPVLTNPGINFTLKSVASALTQT